MTLFILLALLIFFLIPYHVDVAASRTPWANYLLLAFTAAVSIAAGRGAFSRETLLAMVLHDASIGSLVGHVFLHGGVFHLGFNLLFLWLFGNAICAKVGNLWYLPLYLGLGILSGLGHLALDGRPAIGASGAINGLVGAYLVLFPVNSIRCWYWACLVRMGTFACASYWMILYWFAWDILGVSLGLSGVAYWGHLSGFAAGFALTTAFLALRVLAPDRFERTLFQALSGQRGTTSKSLLAASRARREAQRTRITTPPPVSRPSPAPIEIPGGRRAIQVLCGCGKRLRAPESLRGQRRDCPSCGSPLTIRPAEA